MIWKKKVYDFRLQHAARKIQRMVRKKFIAPFIELYKIIYSEFKDGEQRMSIKKWEPLRGFACIYTDDILFIYWMIQDIYSFK